MKNQITPLLLLLMLISISCGDDDDTMPENPADMPYDVTVIPANFETAVTGNTYFPLGTGQVFTYKGLDEENDSVKVVTELTTDTKVIMGVTCSIVRDRAYTNGELVEDTFDWYAQDKDGNVWYFGEDTKEIEDGEVVGTDGSWEAGADNAIPGIIMFANPIPGVWYRQEYYAGEAEDVGQILSISASVDVPFGQYNNCVQTAEWNLLEPGIVEQKFYAPGVGLVRTVSVKGESGFENLVKID